MDLCLLTAGSYMLTGTVGVQPCVITLFTAPLVLDPSLIRAPLSQDLRDATPSPGFVMLRLSALAPKEMGVI